MPKKTEVVDDLPAPAQDSEFFEIPFREGAVTVPRERGKWPTRAILALERGDNLEAVERVLGPAQWDRVVDSEIVEFESFLESFGEVLQKVLSS